MMRVSISVGFIMSGLCGVILTGASITYAGDAAKGKTIYERHCVTCHGAEGKGDGPAGKFMNPKPANFTSPESMKKPDAELLKTIESGKTGTPMGGWKGTLSPEQMQDVLAYVRSLGK
jgi:mono/diheme cytochrome c family protein